jgi:hypothetical protein
VVELSIEEDVVPSSAPAEVPVRMIEDGSGPERPGHLPVLGAGLAADLFAE